MNRIHAASDPLMASLMQEAAANIRARAQREARGEFQLWYWNNVGQRYREFPGGGFPTEAERDAKREALRGMGIATAIRKGGA